MRIGFEAKRLFLNDRGLGNYARNLLYGLIKYFPDNDYHLYSPELSDKYINTNYINNKKVSIHTPKGLIASLSKSAWRSINLGKISSKENLQILHGLAQELPRDIKKSKAKSIVTIHDMIFLRHPEFYSLIDRKIYLKKVKFAVENADHVVAISQQTKNDLIEKFRVSEDKLSVVYQSCNEVFYKKRTKPELTAVRKKWNLPDNFLLYVGALNENKNVLIILKALTILKGKVDLPLVVVGQGKNYKKKLGEYAIKAQLSGQLIFASELANPTPIELSSFYQMASIFIFPSYYEGFGIPILESRFSGTQVIASNSSCLEEAGEDESLYFNPDNAEQLANLLSNKLISLGEVSQIGSQFTLQGSTEKLIRIYDSV